MPNLRSSFFCVAVASLILMFSAHETIAQSAQYERVKTQRKSKKVKGSKKSKKQGDKLDISDLEKKYWAPKDTDFSVVQNRTYTKAKRYSVSLLAGPVMNDNFSEGMNGALSVNYYFSERHGMEFSYVDSSGLGDNSSITQFKTLSSGGGVLPDYGRIRSYAGLSYNWVPFYAKMSFLSQKIIYFDMVISPGLGMTTYDQYTQSGTKSKSEVTYSLDFSQYFFLSKKWAVRVDLRNRWYNEQVLGFQSGQEVNSTLKNRALFLMGLTYYH